MQCTYTVTLRYDRVTIVTVEKQEVSHILCVSIALVIQYAKRIRRTLTVLYFYRLSHQRHNFRKNVTDHKMRVSIFSTTFVRNISHSKKN